MAGKDGRMHPNVEMRPDSECMHMHMHGVPEGDGRWWWALNGCTNQPEGWPLGPVWPTTGPKGHPSGWLVHPLSAHHHLPSPSGTPCMRTRTHSESGRISTFGCICPSLPAILEDFFHHKPALVASFILWLEYLLCAHHLPSTSGNIPHCTCTRAPAPSPAALPHWDVPVHPCFPLPGGIFTTNQP